MNQPPTQQLCASCDRCRARKTKCDGRRPCGNCVTRYKKVNKVDTLEGVDFSAFDCIYSPAKRRGPIPGKSSQARATAQNKDAETRPFSFSVQGQAPSPMGQGLNNGMFSFGLDGTGAVQLQQQQHQQVPNIGNSGQADGTNFSSDELKQMLALQQQLLVQQQQMQSQQQQQGMMVQLASMSGGGVMNAGGLQGVQNNMAANIHNDTAARMGGMMGIGNTATNVGSHQSVFPDASVNGSAMNASNNLLNTGGNNFQNNFQTQTQQQQQQQQQQIFQQQPMGIPSNQVGMQHQATNYENDRSAKRVHTVDNVSSSSRIASNGLPNSVAAHLPMLTLNNPTGASLRSYFELSTNDVLSLPPIPTDEQYCARLNEAAGGGHQYSPDMLPTYDQSALHAARFSELALGALANNQVPLALELSNASVMCLRNCVEEPSHKSCMYDVARAYLLHGIFRSFRGDMVRYFKYRRVCMTHILQLNTEPHVEALLAAVSFHDAWAYMLHNASEDALPDIDESLPRLNCADNGNANPTQTANEIQAKYGCCTVPSSVAADPMNQMWMQGSPPVFLNNEASPVSRSLDAFACAIRTCCDQANTQFADMAKAAGINMPSGGGGQNGHLVITATTTAVMANENELCSRNIVLSAKSLLNSHGASSSEKIKRTGLTMISSALSAFLDTGEMGGDAGPNENGGNSMVGFSDGQIKNLLTACDIVIQNPLLLHSPGPLYHMASNAAIMLCHLLNGINANCGTNANNGQSPSPSPNSKVEGILFDEAFDTFMALRKLLNIHRKGLPVKLRCHGIPRPSNIGPFKNHLSPDSNNSEETFIDMGETLMCLCRGCQGFVLMGCSPCVAAERSMKAAKRSNSADEVEQQWNDDDNDFERQIGEMDDLDLDDDALLEVLSRIVQN